jgi:hypothetical protein
MDYLDNNGAYNKKKVLEGISEIDEKIQDMLVKDVIDKSKLTRLRYEQMLRGLYLYENPFQ